MTLVSVIIPTRNRAALVREAIDSVLAVARAGFDLEVIVVDDGSTDDTASLVARYPVVYLAGAGQGASAARNAGIRAAHGDFIAFLDDDDVWLPNNVSPQLSAFAANPEFGAVHAQVQLTGPDRMPWGAPVPTGPLSSGWIFHDLLIYWPQLASLVVRRSVFADIGLFSEALHSEEEWDLVLRIARRYPIGRVAEPVALFRQRLDNDEELAYRRFPDTMAVFRRYTRAEPPRSMWSVARVRWQHRGWYAGHFLDCAQAHLEGGEPARAWRSVGYAVRVSPPHVLLHRPLFWRTVTRLIAGQARMLMGWTFLAESKGDS